MTHVDTRAHDSWDERGAVTLAAKGRTSDSYGCRKAVNPRSRRTSSRISASVGTINSVRPAIPSASPIPSVGARRHESRQVVGLDLRHFMGWAPDLQIKGRCGAGLIVTTYAS